MRTARHLGGDGGPLRVSAGMRSIIDMNYPVCTAVMPVANSAKPEHRGKCGGKSP